MTFESLNSGTTGVPGVSGREGRQHPLLHLDDDDLNLVTELVLHSGSLKDLARVYGVSYPTIRGRLDALIERLRAAVAGRPRDPVAEFLASLVERGEMSASTARMVLDRVREAGQRDRERDKQRSEERGEGGGL